jgi:hypothetical protein
MKHKQQIARRAVRHPSLKVRVDDYAQLLQPVSRNEILQCCSTETAEILNETDPELFSFRCLDKFAEARSLAVRKL